MKKKYFMISLSLAVIINLVLLFPDFNPPAVSADEIKLKVTNYFPPPSMQSKIMVEFIKELEIFCRRIIAKSACHDQRH